MLLVRRTRPLGARRSDKFWVPAFLAALAVAFFYRLTLLGEALFWGMPLLQFFPWRTFAVSEYLSGRVPLWNPHAGMGAPLAANLQSGVFYPLNFFYLFLPIDRAMTVTVVLHVFLAGWLTYLFLRRLGVGTGGGLVAACTYMFSGFLIAQAGFHNVLSTLAWVPGVSLCIEAWIASRSRLWAAGLAGSVAMLLTAGFIQSAYYGLVLAAAYLAWRVVTQALPPVRPGKSAWATLIVVGALFLLGAAIAAVQLIPTYELTQESVRQGGLDYSDATNYSLFPGQLVTALAPTFFGTQASGDWWGPGAPWEGVIYLGVLPFLLALLALAKGPRPLALFFGLAALTGLFLATGRYNPLFPFLFDYLPGLRLFHAPARFVLWYAFPVAVLAGLGWAALRDGPPGTGLRLGLGATAAGVGVLLMLLAVLTLFPALPLASTTVLALQSAGNWLLAGGAAMVAAARWPRYPWSVLAVGLIVLDLFLFGRDLTPSTDPQLYAAASAPPIEAVRTEAGLNRTFVTDAAYGSVVHRLFEFRQFHDAWKELSEMREALVPNLATFEGVYEVHNYDPLKVGRADRLRLLAEGADLPSPLLDLMGVRFLINPENPADARLWLFGGAAFYRRAEPLPRAYLVTRVVSVADREAAFQFVGARGFDPRREAAVEAAGDPQAFTFPTAGPRAASITEYSTQRVSVETDGGGGFLILTDTYYPGWKALVDGQERPVLPANAAFRGVFLNPGDRAVEFLYDPASFKIGALISVFASAATVLLAASSLRLPWRSPAVPGSAGILPAPAPVPASSYVAQAPPPARPGRSAWAPWVGVLGPVVVLALIMLRRRR